MASMKRIKVTVTAADIKLGCAGNGGNCPVARAIQRALKMPQIHVTTTQVWKNYANGRTIAILPPTVQEWIRKFDVNEKVKPFSFYLEVK